MRFFLALPLLVTLSCEIFFFLSLVVSICFAGRFAVDGQRSCSHRVSCWLEGLVSIRGAEYRPVCHPDGADSHSCRAVEFLPAVKGGSQWKQACHQGGPERAVSATGRHSRYRLPLLFKSPAKSGSLVKSTVPPRLPLPLSFSQFSPIKVQKLIWPYHLIWWVSGPVFHFRGPKINK